jgi:branched-chain amino acid transport system substrate-binding protein
MRSTRRAALAAVAGMLAVVGAGCGDGARPAPPVTTTAALPVRTLYVQAPLTGPAADEGRAMVDAVRLVVDQKDGVAGAVGVIVRTLDDGGEGAATDPARCARNAERAAADPSALAVIGTYELDCSEAALQVLRPAGLFLVSPLNAAAALPGALRLAPTAGDQGTAAAQYAKTLGDSRVAIVSEHPGAAAAFAGALAAAAPAAGIDPVIEIDARSTALPLLVGELRDARTQLVALAGSPGAWSTAILHAIARMPDALRPAVIAPQSFDTLAFLAQAGADADGVHVISRLVSAEQLGGDARSFAGAYAELHGQPPPVAVYAGDAADAVLRAAAKAGATRRGMGAALAGLPAHDGLLGRWAATPGGGITPRRLAVLTVAAGAFGAERAITLDEPLPPSGGVK